MAQNLIVNHENCDERKRKSTLKDDEIPKPKTRKLYTVHMFNGLEITVITDTDKSVWFKGTDVCNALELKNPRLAIYQFSLRKPNCVKKMKEFPSFKQIHNYQPEANFISEGGMNLFLLQTRMPMAFKFQDWVSDDVLISIRKYNKYETTTEENPYKELNMKLEESLAETKCQLKQKDEDIKKLNFQLFSLKPNCVMPNQNPLKQEYLIIIDLNIGSTFYAARIQDVNYDKKIKDLKRIYPN
jgi:prophage antirepressor-like protein